MSDLGSGWFGRKRAALRSSVASKSLADKPRPRRSGIMALEPRIMYDAAAAATVGAAAQTHNDGAPDHAAVSAAEQHAPAVTPSNTGAPDTHASPTQRGSLAQSPNVQTPPPPPAAPEDVKTTSTADASHDTVPAGGVHEIVFIDSRAPDAQVLAGGVKQGITVVMLDSNKDGLGQIADYLAAHPDPDLATIDIVGHGENGKMFLGSTALSSANAGNYAVQFAAIGHALQPGGDLMLYGCDVADDAALLPQIAAATGVDVAASTGLVGSAAQGGSWTLDARDGDITSDAPFTAATLALYPDVLSDTAPTIAVAGSGTYTEVAGVNSAASPVAVSTGVTLSDLEDANFTGASVTISANYITGVDVLDANVAGTGITKSYSNGVLTLSGTDTIANYKLVLDSVTFSAAGDDPTAHGANTARTLSWTVNDGTQDATASTSTVTVVDTNDAPVADTVSATGDEGLSQRTAIVLSATDADSAIASFDLTSLPANGNLYLAGSGGSALATTDHLAASGNSVTVYFEPTDINWNGDTSFTYTATDGTTSSAVATATVHINSVNDEPTTAAHTVTATEDTSYAFKASDFPFADATDAPSPNTLADIIVTSLPVNGTLSYNGTALTAADVVSGFVVDIANIGLLTFLPGANDNGASYASFSFAVKDNGGVADNGHDTSAAATMTIDVTPVNDAPTTAAHTVTTTEDASYAFQASDFPFADTADGAAANTLADIVVLSRPVNGTLSYNGTALTAADVASGFLIDIANIGLLTFLPAANGNGSAYASFNFAVKDNGGVANSGHDTSTAATMTIDVTPVSDAPTTAAHTVTATEDTSYAFQASDFPFADVADAPSPNTLADIIVLSLPANGTLSYNGTALTAADVASGFVIDAANIGLPTFLPGANDNGASYASFSFALKDNGGVANGGHDTSASATMTIDVTAVNDLPTVTVVPGADTTVVEAGGVGNATPGDPSASGQITITDVDVGESHFLTPSPLVATYGTFTFNTTTGEWTYTLDQTKADPLTQGQAVTDTLTVTSADGTTSRNTVVNITGSNDAATFGGTSTGAVTEDTITSASGTLTVTDADAGQSGFNSTTSALVATYGTFTFVPGTGAWTYNLDHNKADSLAANQVVTDRLTVHAIDGTAQDIVVTITGTNDAPVASAAPDFSIAEQTSYNLKTRGLAISDVDGGVSIETVTLTVTEGTLNVTAGSSGATIVSGSGTNSVVISGTLAQINKLLSSDGTSTISYIDNTDTPGTGATLTLTVKDSLNATSSAVTNISLIKINDAPTVTVPSTPYGATENVALSLSGPGLSVADVDSGGGTVSVTLSVGEGRLHVNLPGGITLTGQDSSTVTLGGTLANINALLASTGAITYTDANDQPSASTLLTVSINDNGNTGSGGALTASASVAINISPTGDAPSATDDAYGLTASTGLITTAAAGVLSNDSDADGHTFTASLVTGPAHGSVTLNPDGSFTYTPTAGYSGIDTFTYKAVDGVLQSAVATVTMNVIPTGTGAAADQYWITTWGNTSSSDPAKEALIVAATRIMVTNADGTNQLIWFKDTTAINYQGGLISGPIQQPNLLVIDYASGLYYITAFQMQNGGTLTDTIYMGHINSSAAPTAIYVHPDSNRALDGLIRDLAIDPATHRLYMSESTNYETGTTADNGIFYFNYDPSSGAIGARQTLVTFSPRYSDTQLGTEAFMMTSQPINNILYFSTINYHTWDGYFQIYALDVTNSNPATNTKALMPTGQFAIDYHTGNGEYLRDMDYDPTNQRLYFTTFSYNQTTAKVYNITVNGAANTNAPQAVTLVGNTSPYLYNLTYNASNNQFAFVDGNNQRIELFNVTNNNTLTFASSFTLGLPPVNPSDPTYGTPGSPYTYPVSIFFTPADRAPVADITLPTSLPTQTSIYNATEQLPLSLKGTLSVSDPDGGTSIETATLSVGSGVLTVVAGTSGATVTGSGGQTVTIKGTLAQINALLSSDPSSSVSYTANSDTPPSHTALSLTIDDGRGLTATKVAMIVIAAVNDAPTATILPPGGPRYQATEQVVLNLKTNTGGQGLMIGDVDAGNGIMTVTLSVDEGTLNVTAGSSGASVSGSGSSSVTIKGTVLQINALLRSDGTSTVTYLNGNDRPAANTTLKLVVNDNGNTGPIAGSATASVVIDITSVNDAPVAQDDVYAGMQGAAVIGTSVLANDTDVDTSHGSLTATVVGQPAHGTLVFNSDGTFTYTPAFGFSGSDYFTYTASDGGGQSNIATVTINLANSPLVANNDSYAATEDTVLVVNGAGGVNGVIANDLDSAPGSHITGASVITLPSHGTLSFDMVTGNFTYTPNSNFNGVDSFTYQITDDQGSPPATATVTIIVAATNDAPVLSVPSPSAVSYVENAAATALFTGETVTDPDAPVNFQGGSLSLTLGNGEGTDQIVLVGAGFTVDGSGHLIDGGNIIGAISGLGTATVSITGLTAFATPGEVNRLATAFGFLSTSDNPSAADRSVTLTFNDGGNVGGAASGLSASVSQTIHVVPVNDAPSFSGSAGAGYTENSAPVAVATGVTVSDVDSPDFNGGRLDVALSSGSQAGDILSIASGSGVTISGSDVSYNGILIGSLSGNDSSFTIAFNASANASVVKALVEAVQFSSSSDNPGSGTRHVTFTLVDGDGTASGGHDSTSFDVSVAVQPVNDVPTIVGPGTLLASAVGSPITVLGVVFSDRDDGGGLETATFTGNGVFTATTAGGVTVGGTDGARTLTGTVANINAFIAAGALTFAPAAQNTDVQVIINDNGNTGGAAQTSATTHISVLTNRSPSAPANAYTDAPPSIEEGAAAGTLLHLKPTATDPDNDTVTYSLTGRGSAAFMIDANGDVVVAPGGGASIDFESNALHTITLTVVASDGHGSTSSTDFVINVTDQAPSVPVDANTPTDGTVSEGAVNGDTVGITASSTDVNSPSSVISYTLTDDAGGRFQIDSSTGVVTVKNAALLNYENLTSHQITVQASDGTLTSSQNFTIAVTDVAPTVPVDASGAANAISEGAANGDAVGIQASSSDVHGGIVTYTLTDNAGGRFAIDGSTGVVTVLDATLLNFEANTSHSITVRASDPSGLFNEQTFLIAVTDVAPTAPVDGNAAADSVSEGAVNGDLVGLTATSSDVNGGQVIFSLSNNAGGRFAIDSSTGVVSVANAALLDYETNTSHSITVRAADPNGLFTETTYTIAVTDVAPTQPVDGDAATNTVVEGAATGTVVGVTGASTDIHGGTVTYSLSADASNGGFAIDASTGVVTVADASKVDFEASGGSFDITIKAADPSGAFTEQTFTIAVTDVAPTTPVDNEAASGGTVSEGAVNGDVVGITIASTDINGGLVTLTLSDDAGGRFAIDTTTGVVTVANAALLNFEDNTSHSITVRATDPSGMFTEQTFTIAVTDVAPTTPADGNAGADTVSEGAVNGDLVGITATSSDVHGGQVIFSLTDTAGGRFAIDSSTGVVSVANASLLDFETATSHSITVRAADPNGLYTETTFTITVTDVPPTVPVDANAATDTVVEGAANGTVVGLTGHSTDVHGGTVTYALSSDASHGGFAIDAATGVVTVADASKVDFESSGGSYVITIRASDPSGAFTEQSFTIAVTDVAPVATGEAFTTDEDTAIVIAPAQGLLVNDTDINGAPLTAVLDAGPAHGTLTLNADGSFKYLSFRDYNGADSFTYHVSDGTLSSAVVTVNLTINPVNDAPVLTSGNTLDFNANTRQAILLYPGLGLHDVDSANLVGARIAITSGFEPADDTLGFVNQNGIVGSFDAGTGVLTLTGVSSVENYRAALASVTFLSTTQRNGPRTVEWVVDDGSAQFNRSLPAQTALNVSGIIVPPHLFADVPPVTPAQLNGSPSLGFDTSRSNLFVPNERVDGYGSSNAYGYVFVSSQPVLATAYTGVEIDVALGGLRDSLGGDVVYIIARQANGDPLPDWLKFDSVSGKFAGLPPDGMVASIQGDPLSDNDATGALPPNPDLGTPPATQPAKTITVEVMARDSKGNVAVTTFIIELRPRTGKQGWYMDWSVPGDPRHAALPAGSPELAAIEAAVRDATGPDMSRDIAGIVEPAIRGLTSARGEAIIVGSRDAAPAGRAGLSEQMAGIGWRAMTAQTNALLASLQQGR